MLEQTLHQIQNPQQIAELNKSIAAIPVSSIDENNKKKLRKSVEFKIGKLIKAVNSISYFKKGYTGELEGATEQI